MSPRDDRRSANQLIDYDHPPAYSPVDSASPLRSPTNMTSETIQVTRTSAFIPQFLRRRTLSRPDAVVPASAENERSRPPALLLNKDLPVPPTPPYPSADSPSPPENTSRSSSVKRSASYTTLSLAHASLGVGLPPLLSKEGPLAPTEESERNHAANPSRRATLAFSAELPEPPRRPKSVAPELRRRRGLSLGPFDLFSSSRSSEGYLSSNNSTSVEPNSPKLPENKPSPVLMAPGAQSLPRKPSIWRLRVSSFGSAPTAPPPRPVRSPLRPAPTTSPLPQVPTSPFIVDVAHSTKSFLSFSDKYVTSFPTSLARRHSHREGRGEGSTPIGCKDERLRTTSTAENGRRSIDLPFELSSTNSSRGDPATSTNNTANEWIQNVPAVVQSDSVALLSGDQAPPNAAAGSHLSTDPSNSLSVSPHFSPEREPCLEISTISSSSAIGQNPSHSPEFYLNQVLRSMVKSEVASALASVNDELHSKALRLYMTRFVFDGDAIDIALRKMLMELGLPKETQQIDRVIEAFAKQYTLCNPDIFLSNDHPYILAFSIIMLHTDAYNKSNKNKMTKADYVKNTRLPGISSMFLEYLYDNVVFAPFIFIDDPMDINGPPGSQPEKSGVKLFSPIGDTKALGNLAQTNRPKSGKIDPYYLIANNMVSSLKVDVDTYIPPFDPYKPDGTLEPWDEKELRHAFSRAAFVEIDDKNTLSDMPLPVPSPTVGGVGAAVFGNAMGSVDGSGLQFIPRAPSPLSLKVTKTGLLLRKDDTIEGGKRASGRKWKEWSVLLTVSQLLFFRDPGLAVSLLLQSEHSQDRMVLPLLRPDEIISLNDCIVVYDLSYTKHPNTFRLALANGRQILLRTTEERDMNDWIQLVNYASAFRTTGIAMRTDHVTRSSSLPSQQTSPVVSLSPSSEGWDNSVENVEDDLGSAGSCPSPTMEALRMPFPPNRQADSISSPVVSSYQSSSPGNPSPDGVPSLSPPSRSRMLRTKIQELSDHIKTVEAQLVEDLRTARMFTLLSPFQKSGRDKLVAAVVTLAKRVQPLRLELAKLRYHRQLLSQDLKSIQSSASLTSRTTWNGLNPSALSSSVWLEQIITKIQTGSNAGTSRPPSGNLIRPESTSSVAASFLTTPEAMEYALTENLDARTIAAASEHSLLGYSREQDGTPSSADSDKNDDVEKAEDWSKTRAGHRVSLITFPLDLQYPHLHRST